VNNRNKPLISLHDHFVREFTVNADTRTLRLLTAFPSKEGPYRAEGIFEGVEAYVIDGDVLGTILFEIEEVSPLSLYDEFATSMRETFARSGGHAPWVETRDTAQRAFREREINGYSLTSSIGFTGGVWARSFASNWTVAPR